MVRYLGGLKISSKYKKMEPPNIPTTNLCKAKLMRAELLIQTHKKQLVQCVTHLCNIDLNIHVSITEVLSFLVHIHL